MLVESEVKNYYNRSKKDASYQRLIAKVKEVLETLCTQIQKSSKQVQVNDETIKKQALTMLSILRYILCHWYI
jgi:hypothetical protein